MSDGWDDGVLPDTDIEKLLKPNITDFKKSTGLVLPSGGVKGLYIIGAIQYLYETIGLGHIQSYYGTSIGAVISGLLIVGYTPLDILVFICVQKIMTLLMTSFNLAKILTEKRMIDAKVFTHLLTDMITKKVGFIPTLGELYTKFQKKLCVVTISRDNIYTPVYVSSESHPDLSMVHALHMTSSIPYVFGYAMYDKVEYFDGAFLDPFPILYASQREEWVFGIDIDSVFEKSDDLLTDVRNMMKVPVQFINDMMKKQVIHGSWVMVHTNDEIIANKTLELIHMFNSGYRQCKEQLFIEVDIKSRKEKND